MVLELKKSKTSNNKTIKIIYRYKNKTQLHLYSPHHRHNPLPQTLKAPTPSQRSRKPQKNPTETTTTASTPVSPLKSKNVSSTSLPDKICPSSKPLSNLKSTTQARNSSSPNTETVNSKSLIVMLIVGRLPMMWLFCKRFSKLRAKVIMGR